MSTNDYLKGLSLDQLIYARDRADLLIKEKQREKKRVVWCVENDHIRLAFFPADKYVSAAERLLMHAKKYATDETMDARDKILRLAPDFILESEYGEFEELFESTNSEGKKK